MAKKRQPDDSEKLSQEIIKGMQEKKAEDIVLIDLRGIKNSIADFFVVCTGNSDTQVESITDSIEEEVFKARKENPVHLEGKNNKEWMLIDYIDVVAHAFYMPYHMPYLHTNAWSYDGCSHQGIAHKPL